MSHIRAYPNVPHPLTGGNAMKYRKKPVVIEAMHFTTNNEDERGPMEISAIVQWINSGGTKIAHHDFTSIYIYTLEGEMRADVGDWVIRGVQGEFYPCKPDIFALTYEPVRPDGSEAGE